MSVNWISPSIKRWLVAIMLVVLASPAPSRTVSVPLADGFDFPVGKPNAGGYYKARGFTQYGHRGEDWNGNGGGNTDLGDPVYSTADGVVMFSQDIRQGWGNMVIIRHVLRDTDGEIRMVDSLYGHLDKRLVRKDQIVKKGELVGTIGTAHGLYPAHLHFEIHKNLEMGPNRTGYAPTYANYYSPTSYIQARRKLDSGWRNFAVPVDTFSGYYAGKPPPVNIPTKESRAEASLDSKKAQLDRLIEKNKKNAPVMNQQEEDSFWEALKAKLRGGKPVAPGTGR